jgi:hypothetical protein
VQLIEEAEAEAMQHLAERRFEVVAIGEALVRSPAGVVTFSEVEHLR